MTGSSSAVLALSLCLGACSGPSSESGRASVDISKAVHRYNQVHGVVQSAPAGSDDRVFIEVQQLPDFIGPSGRKQTLAKLVLPFRADRTLNSRLAPGDKIVFDAEVDWDAPNPGKLLTIRAQ